MKAKDVIDANICWASVRFAVSQASQHTYLHICPDGGDNQLAQELGFFNY